MKKLISLLLFLSITAFAADVRWTFTDFTSSPHSVKKIYITPIAAYGTNSTNIITGDRRTYTNNSLGSLIVSNVIVGRSYRVELHGPFTETVITNSFDSGVSGFVEAVNYIAAPLSDGGLTSYSKTAADARFHNVSGDTSTNAAFRGTFKIPAGATVGYVLTVTNADGSSAWSPGSGSSSTSGALTNNDTRGITFLNGLTVQNNLEVSSISSGAGNLSLSPEASGNVVISVGQLVGNGGGLTNLTGAGSSIAAGTNIVTVTNGSLVTVHGTANVTQSGLAAGSYAVNAVLATNLVDAVGAYSPQHFNIGKTPVLNRLITSNLTVRMLTFGDDAFLPSASIIAAFTNMGFAINGTGGGSTYANGNYARSVAAGTTTYTEPSGSNPYIIGTLGLATGASLTNVIEVGQNQGIDTDRICVKYWKNTGFGTLQVFTNTYGNTPVLCKTLNANVGSFSFAITNFDVARISNCVVSLVSSGTNFVPAACMGQWKTNGQNLRLDNYTGGNIGTENFTDTSARSNMFSTLLTDFDVLVVSDLGGGGGLAAGTNLWRLIQNNNLALDVVISSSIIQSNNGAYDSRAVALGIGKTTPFVVVDTAAFLAPTNAPALDSLYDNISHLNSSGNLYIGDKFVNALGWNEEGFRTTIKRPQTNYVFLGVDQLRNDSGALTLSHLYSVIGTTYRTWGHYVAAGTFGANSSIFYPGNELGQRKNMYARMLVLTTNVISYNLFVNQNVFPIGANITTFAGPAIETGNYTLGASGQTNISYTEWVSIKPTVKGPWGGWVLLGYGATSKAYASFLLGVELRSDPDNPWDNW